MSRARDNAALGAATLLLLGAVALLCVLAMGCAGTPYSRGRSVVAWIALAEMGASTEWERADAAKGRAILDAAHARPGATREEVAAELAAWRVTSDAVGAGFRSAAEATIAAKQAIDAAEALKAGFELAPLIGPVYHAFVAVEHALRAAGVEVPSLASLLSLARGFLNARAPVAEPPAPDGEGR